MKIFLVNKVKRDGGIESIVIVAETKSKAKKLAASLPMVGAVRVNELGFTKCNRQVERVVCIEWRE